MNKLPWFTHDSNAHQDLWLRAMIQTHGHEFSTFYWTTIELFHLHGKGGVLQITSKDWYEACMIHPKVLTRLVDAMGTKDAWTIVRNGNLCSIKNEKFIKRQHNLRSKAASNYFQTTTEDTSKLLGFCAKNKNKKKKKKRPYAQPSPAVHSEVQRKCPKSPFNILMDGVMKDYWNLDAGSNDHGMQMQVNGAYKRHGRALSEIVAMAGGDHQKARDGIDAIGAWMKSKGLSWNLNTVARHFLDWNASPRSYQNGAERK